MFNSYSILVYRSVYIDQLNCFMVLRHLKLKRCLYVYSLYYVYSVVFV